MEIINIKIPITESNESAIKHQVVDTTNATRARAGPAVPILRLKVRSTDAWRARRARAYNGGLGAEPPAGSRGRAPGQGVRGAKLP